jgi:tetratricopeptide (TPR) repeat protein
MTRALACRIGRATAGVAAAAAIVLLANGARADPKLATVDTVWGRARRPDLARPRELVAEADGYVFKYQQLHAGRPEADVLGDTYLMRAAELLEQAGATTSRDLYLRYRLAEVYALREQHDKEIRALEGIGRSDPPAPLRAQVFADLAVAYAHAGRVADEIKAYDQALQVQPLAPERSRLIANRAEAYMLLGDATTAVAGYRAALALLSNDYMMFDSGATTLWGLAVGLDRTDDLDAALDAVRLARVYDPGDKRINGPGWFYEPEYDRHWYEALGHWEVARKADVHIAVRSAAYAAALGSWSRYLDFAAPGDKWAALARVRLLKCARERAEFLQRRDAHALSAAPDIAEFKQLVDRLRNKSPDEARVPLQRFLAKHPPPGA